MRVLACLLAFLCLAGCAAGGSIQQTSEAVAAIDSSRSGGVVVTSLLPNRDKVVANLQLAITVHLLSKRVFNELSEPPEDADILLNVTITDVTEVGPAMRFLLGAFAGQARLVADIDIVERATGRSLGKMQAEGTSSAGHAMAGTTVEALDQVATQISDYLLRNRRI